MITYIKINGFKSFHNFEMEFTPFTVVAGANASGKSNLFDALKLLGRLAESDNLKKAFSGQRGEFIELFTQYDNGEYAKEIHFVVEMLVSKKVSDNWKREVDLKYTRLKYELKIKRFTNTSGVEDVEVTYEHLKKLNHQEDNWIKIIDKKYIENWRPKVKTGKRGIPYIETKEENQIMTVLVPQDGTQGNKRRFPLSHASRTVLSTFDTIDFPHVFAAKEEMRSWKFLQLNPDDLREPTHKQLGSDVITSSGKNLAAALYRIKQKDAYSLVEISRRLQEFLPHFTKVDVIDEVAHQQYIIKLIDKKGKGYSSRVLSEGTLRLLALCIFEYDEKYTGLICFEEPENGIHPFRIQSMVELLKDLSVDFSDNTMPLRQVIVNTHSPIVVGHLFNWKEDKNVSIWYADIIDRIVTLNRKRSNLSATKILPVVKDDNSQLQFLFSEVEKKVTLKTVQHYLKTADFNRA
jgi:predicted ATPase